MITTRKLRDYLIYFIDTDDLGAGDFSYDVTLTYTSSASFFRTHWTNDSQENPENIK